MINKIYRGVPVPIFGCLNGLINNQSLRDTWQGLFEETERNRHVASLENQGSMVDVPQLSLPVQVLVLNKSLISSIYNTYICI